MATRIEQALSWNVTRRQAVKIDQGRLSVSDAVAFNEAHGRPDAPNFPRHVEAPINTQRSKKRSGADRTWKASWHPGHHEM